MNKNFNFSQMGNPFPSMGGMAGGLCNAAMDDQAKFYATMNDRSKDSTTMNDRSKDSTTIEMEKDAHGVYRATW